MVWLTASILGLGNEPSAFGQTLATLSVYIVAQVMAEHKKNQERQRSFE